jgi:Cu(I)/Ag(I) efflux system protein CusF
MKAARSFMAAALVAAASLALAQAPGAAPASDLADGEVRRIDRDARKITLRHGEIRNLSMPPMTMVFQVKDPALLDRVKVGDKVRFRAVQEEGAYRVTDLQAAP